MENRELIHFAILGIFITYAVYEGYREAFYYHIKNKSGLLQNINEHAVFTLQRISVGSFIFIAYYLCFPDYWLAAYKCLTLAMMFPFLHDGTFYFHRNRLDNSIYKKKFWDMSYTSTAITTFLWSPPMRSCFFTVGLFRNLYINYHIF